MNHNTSLDLKTLLGAVILTVCAPVFSQDSLHYTRLRIVNSNNDTSLSVIVVNTNQDVTLRVQGERSDNGAWDDVFAKWEVLDSLLMGKMAPLPPDAACMWTFSGLTYASGRLRVTFGNDSITEPDTIRIEIQPGCGPIGGRFTFLTPLSHVETGDTITAIVWIGTPGDLNGWPYCMVPYWCYSDSSNVNIFYLDTLAPDSSPPSLVITGEGIARVGQQDSTHFPVTECFTNEIDTVKFVFYNAGLHKLFIGGGNYNIISMISNISFTIYPRSAVLPGFVKHDNNSLQREKMVMEFFNLRGQRLPQYGIRHADGIILERVIEPTGKVSVMKKYIPLK